MFIFLRYSQNFYTEILDTKFGNKWSHQSTIHREINKYFIPKVVVLENNPELYVAIPKA